MNNASWHMINQTRTESRIWFQRNWMSRNIPRVRVMLRACIADMRAANELIGK
jgi:hypothetical protein